MCRCCYASNEWWKLSIKSLSCGRYTADVPASLNVSAAVMRACVLYVCQFCHPFPPPFPFPFPSFCPRQTSLARICTSISSPISKSIDRVTLGGRDQAQGYRTRVQPLRIAVRFFFFFLPSSFPVWFPLLRLLAAVNKCARNAIVMPSSCNSHQGRNKRLIALCLLASRASGVRCRRPSAT